MLCDENNIERLDVNELVRFKYLALYNAGRYASEITPAELTRVQLRLSDFLANECLMVLSEVLEHASTDSTARILSSVFNDLPKPEAYIAIAPMRIDPDNPEASRYVESIRPMPESNGTSYVRAVDQALDNLALRLNRSPDFRR